MLRAFWTWDPVSSGDYRAFDERLMYRENKWFFDKSVWQKMFRAMAGCGLNAMILANTHPFPFMVDLPDYPDAAVIDEEQLRDYQRMHHWIFETAFDYEIAPYLCFFCGHYPGRLAEAQSDSPVPTDVALEYTHHCVRELLSTYPDLAGIVVDAADVEAQYRVGFVQQAVVDALDAVRPDAALYLRLSDHTDPLASGLKRRGDRPMHYSVKYSGDYLVDANPDAMFTRSVEAVGAERVVAETTASNFQPWTSFSFDTVEGVLENLTDLGCEGVSLAPLAPPIWPKSSDTYFKHQFQRDLVWYSAWGGSGVERLLQQGQPKWLLRNHRLIPGFQAGSRILELLAIYFDPGRTGRWLPQFCSVVDSGADTPRLLTIEDMLRPSDASSAWWTDVTGDRVVGLAEYLESGTPEDAYGPDELIEELTDLSEQAVAAGEKGMRSASGEKELPSFARDAFCMGRLGEFYVERIKAALAHGRGETAEALDHMSRALGLYREIKSVDGSHRNPYRLSIGRDVITLDFLDIVKALESELESEQGTGDRVQ